MPPAALVELLPRLDPAIARPPGPAIASAALAAAVASGLLLAIAFPPFNLHPIAWFALVPFLLTLPRSSPRVAWIAGTLLGIAFYRITLAWAFALDGPLAAIGILVFSVLMGLAFRTAKLLQRHLGETAMWLCIPVFFTGQEILRSESLDRYRMAYAALGYSQAGNLWIAQIASLGGVYSLTLLIVAANSALAAAIQRRTRATAFSFAAVAVLVVLLAAVSQPAANPTAPSIPVAAVQSEPTNDGEYLDLTRLAATASPSPAIIVLPEHAIDGYADLPHPFVKKLAAIARDARCYVCIGAHFRASANLPCDYDNVAMLIGPDGQVIGAQAKSVPIPFFKDGNPARTQQVFQTQIGRLGLAICFDTDFTDITRRLVIQGAEVLLIPVKNPERWPELQRVQQAAMAQIRAIESRRYAVRAASSGISQIIAPTGTVLSQRTQIQGPGILTGHVAVETSRSFFTRAGYLLPQAIAYTFLAAIIVLTFVPIRTGATPTNMRVQHVQTRLAAEPTIATRRPCGE